MKNSSYINEKVFDSNLKILKKQNETKELFFKCLNEGRDYEYFKEKLEKIWDNLDYSFLQDQLIEYETIIKEQLPSGKKEEEVTPKEFNPLFALVPLSVILLQQDKLVRQKEREYRNSLNSYGYKEDKEDYLKLKVERYNDKIVPYYLKNEKIRYVSLNTYASMIHNTNLTRTAWNTALNQADELGIDKFYIPYHSFSCPHCMEHQNKIMTKEQVIALVGDVETKEGEILHPNCKCILVPLRNGESVIKMERLSDSEKEEIYNIRQKTNTLTLEKERLLTDMKIQKNLGNYDEVDKLNQKRNKINKEIRELKEQLPTEELQKQVTAINR